MELAKKLQIPPGMSVFLVNAPKGFKLDAPLAKKATEGAVLFFAANSKSLMADGKVVFDAAKADRLAWIAYPKAGQLGTDLDRDKLWGLMREMGIDGVRLVSIDDVWSAGRFRPIKDQ